ncbi:thioesterase family protein [Oceanirhabdus sp. W0125-5]|uniref:thioesterase family protein n=1 Tax=Oceanirhabdus sp. W0125-5 TaxID=2999116 RepID=UPI0022F32162|nr:thioesterase family protein [Oceanirhabdus sp. W0125-5]WBW97945.1 thioesterase family protein [Oceanirhabdus sp. W0125-5]
MEFNISNGMKTTLEITVGKEDTASSYGSGAVEVFATPAMIALMENTAKTVVDECLEEDFTTVGIAISTNHIKATPIGMKVKCEATVEKVEGKKIEFKVIAWDEVGKIGEGCHTRYIINVDKFMSKLK